MLISGDMMVFILAKITKHLATTIGNVMLGVYLALAPG